jgi:hypothetical protein
MKKMRIFLLALIVVGLAVSVVSAGGYADPKSFDEWRPTTVADADAGNTIGHFNRAFSHLSDVLYSGIVSTVNTVNPLFASTGGVYSPKTNWASPVYVGEEWQYGGYPYYTDEQMGPISNRCG